MHSRMWTGIGLFILILAGVWTAFIGPQLTQIPADFELTPSLYSVDNFYEEEINDYLGASISNSNFSYETIRKEGNTLLIRNHFDVQTLAGEPFFEVNRVYRIDALTGQHVSIAGERLREGYLFSPGNYSKENYVYWHANYDMPIPMTFVAEENLEGLLMYHFRSDFTADQTIELSSLPNVPEEEGINLDVSLDLWTDPVSGRMINYKEEATAYYYDIQTGQRIHPWNHFTNTFTVKSIQDQVIVAHRLQRAIFVYKQLIPIILTLAGILCVLIGMGMFEERRIQGKAKGVYSFVVKRGLQLFILVTLIFAFMALSNLHTPPTEERAIIGIIHPQVGDVNENLRGFRDGLAEHGYVEGKNLTLLIEGPNSTDVEKQVEITQSMLDQDVDLFYTIGTRITFVVKGVQPNIPIVFGLVTYPVQNGLIETLQHSGNNLVGTRGYISAFRQYLAFEELVPNVKSIAFVHLKGDPNSEIQFEEFQSFLTKKGITMIDMSVLTIEEIPPLLESQKENIDAIYGACDVLVVSRGGDEAIISFSLDTNIPTFSCSPGLVEKGALISASANFYDVGKLAGEKAGAILSGIAPTNLETEGPDMPFITINSTTAEKIGVTIPPSVLAEADRIVE